MNTRHRRTPPSNPLASFFSHHPTFKYVIVTVSNPKDPYYDKTGAVVGHTLDRLKITGLSSTQPFITRTPTNVYIVLPTEFQFDYPTSGTDYTGGVTVPWTKLLRPFRFPTSDLPIEC